MGVRVQSVVNAPLKEGGRSAAVEVEAQPAFDSLDLGVAGHRGGARNQLEQADQQGRLLAEREVCPAAEGAELSVALRLEAAHALDHLDAETKRRREALAHVRLAIPQEAKIDVEEPPVRAQHQVVEVAVADREHVRGNAISRAAADVARERRGLDAHRRARVGRGVCLPQVVADGEAVVGAPEAARDRPAEEEGACGTCP
mmetsp:Transcript_37049/g.115965  ORF Transcript_37049/g.115965 Transcript_37049/m.115965 type:complete len:201 (+) Transcript_37049:248-850(+)